MIIKASTFRAHRWLSLWKVLLGTVSLILLAAGAIFWLTPAVTVHLEQHFYKEPIEVSLSANRSGTIHYTLDGSRPSKKSQQYLKPFTVYKTSMLRAALFAEEGGKSPLTEITTYPIFIGLDHSVPVVSLIVDPDDLWDEKKGILAEQNVQESGRDWERKATFGFFEPDQTTGIIQDGVGVRLHGAFSRGLPQKPFRIYANYEDHDEAMRYPFFGDSGINTFNNLVLRNAGNDWSYSYMRDVLAQRIAAQATDLDAQRDRPVVLYLNNEYWGLYYLRERPDEHYLANQYGIDLDNLSILKIPHLSGDDRGKAIAHYGDQAKKDAKRYTDVLRSQQGCRDCSDFGLIEKNFNVDNFIDYFILEQHFANFDWPVGNSKLWRYTSGHELTEDDPKLNGKFNWIFFDLDVTFGHGNKTASAAAKSANSSNYSGFIDEKYPFRNVFFNSHFQELFLARYGELLNSDLSTQAIISQIDQLEAELEPEMNMQISRWARLDPGEKIQPMPQSVAEWKEYVEQLRVFARNRVNGAFASTLEEFNLERTALLSVEIVGEGQILLGAILIDSTQTQWKGEFFGGTKLLVEAVPEKGYRFVRWEGDVSRKNKSSRNFEHTFTDNQTLRAVFEPKPWYYFWY